MKRLILAVISASLISVGMANVSYAKSKAAGEPPHNELKMREHLVQKLKLTAEQQALADQIREDGRKKMEPLMREKKVLHEKMEKIRKENMEEFEKILTKEQKNEFIKMKEQHHKPHAKKHRPLLKLEQTKESHSDDISVKEK